MNDTTTAKSFNFHERLRFSNGHDGLILRALQNSLPNVTRIERAPVADDKAGTDYWVYLSDSDKPLSLDVKIRKTDCKEFGQDDLALETWSIIRDGKPLQVGWTRDLRKRTDLVMWVWLSSGRYCIVKFVPLRTLFSLLLDYFTLAYGTFRQRTGNYESECCFVDRVDLKNQLKPDEMMSGKVYA